MVEPSLNIEYEIAELERKLAEKRAFLEQKKDSGTLQEVPHPKEILREVIREKIAIAPGQGTLPPSFQPPAVIPNPLPTDTPSYLADELKPKVQELVNIALEKSIAGAINMAKATENPALIDAFHDIIVDELYAHLIQRGRLKAIE